MKYEKNHYYPKYCLKYWKELMSKLYNKSTKTDRDFNPKNTFYKKKFYFFDGTDEYEQRLGKIEDKMSILLKKIEDEQESINLTDYETHFIQLFLLLQASRQLNTTEVIKYDETNTYSSNNFLFGVNNVKDESFMKFLMINALESLENFLSEDSKNLGKFTDMMPSSLHLNIIRDKSANICISETSVIIENDIYGNFLYAYFPQTPRTAFLLIKTKYFFNEKYVEKYLRRFSYYSYPSEPISWILNFEILKLKCQYDKESFGIEPSPGHIISVDQNYEKMKQKINHFCFLNFNQQVIDEWNKIIFDEGENVIHPQNLEYIKRLEEKPEPEYRFMKEYSYYDF